MPDGNTFGNIPNAKTLLGTDWDIPNTKIPGTVMAPDRIQVRRALAGQGDSDRGATQLFMAGRSASASLTAARRYRDARATAYDVARGGCDIGNRYVH